MKKVSKSTLNSDVIKPNLNISEANRKEASEVLTNLLANEFVLYSKLKYYHWNIKSELKFRDLHLFLDELAEKANETVDKLAERIRALGFRSIGTLQEFIDYSDSELGRKTQEIPTAKEMLITLLKDYELIASSMRKIADNLQDKMKDSVTSNFLLDLVYHHEKAAWMLRSNIEKF